jgi:hypothetical protein
MSGGEGRIEEIPTGSRRLAGESAMSATTRSRRDVSAAGAATLPWGSRARGTVGQLVGAREFAILVFLVLISVAIGIARPTFFTTSNLLAMGRQMAEIAIMAPRRRFSSPPASSTSPSARSMASARC